MKTIYNAILTEVGELLDTEALRWFDWDKGQLKKKGDNDRYTVAFPCMLIRIGITSTEDVTDTVQDCKANITITLAFDPLSMGRTASSTPVEIRTQGLEPYNTIAGVHRNLQGFTDGHFNPLTRKTAGELTHPDLFVYQIVYRTEFEDSTAEK